MEDIPGQPSTPLTMEQGRVRDTQLIGLSIPISLKAEATRHYWLWESVLYGEALPQGPTQLPFCKPF